MSYMGNDDMSDGVCFEMPVAEVARIINAAKIAQAKLQADAPLVIPDLLELSKKSYLQADMPEETPVGSAQKFDKSQWARDWSAELYRAKKENDERLKQIKDNEGKIARENEERRKSNLKQYQRLKECGHNDVEVEKTLDKIIGELSPMQDPMAGINDLYGERMKKTKGSADASDNSGIIDLYGERIKKQKR